MSQELAEVTCRVCGDRAAVEVGEANAFTLDCDTCGARSEGRVRAEGVVVWR